MVDADLGLAGGDLRAAERTWQLLPRSAAGPGGGEKPGRVLLQSFMPDHPVMQTLVADDRDGFLASEAEARRSRGLPPYGKLVALIVSGPDRGAVDRVSRELGRAAPQGEGLMVLGPADAPLAMLRGRHRRRLLLKADRRIGVQPLVADCRCRGCRVPGTVRVQVDIDPLQFSVSAASRVKEAPSALRHGELTFCKLWRTSTPLARSPIGLCRRGQV